MGDASERPLREKVELGDARSGDMAPEDTDLCEPTVFVRMGGGGWKCDCEEGMLARVGSVEQALVAGYAVQQARTRSSKA